MQTGGGIRSCLHDRENDVGFITDRTEGNWRDHDNSEVPDPVRRSRETICRRTNSQGNNLSRVQPSHAQPAYGEERVEDEEERSCNDTGNRSTDPGHDSENDHRD